MYFGAGVLVLYLCIFLFGLFRNSRFFAWMQGHALGFWAWCDGEIKKYNASHPRLYWHSQAWGDLALVVLLYSVSLITHQLCFLHIVILAGLYGLNARRLGATLVLGLMWATGAYESSDMFVSKPLWVTVVLGEMSNELPQLHGRFWYLWIGKVVVLSLAFALWDQAKQQWMLWRLARLNLK